MSGMAEQNGRGRLWSVLGAVVVLLLLVGWLVSLFKPEPSLNAEKLRTVLISIEALREELRAIRHSEAVAELLAGCGYLLALGLPAVAMAALVFVQALKGHRARRKSGPGPPDGEGDDESLPFRYWTR